MESDILVSSRENSTDLRLILPNRFSRYLIDLLIKVEEDVRLVLDDYAGVKAHAVRRSSPFLHKPRTCISCSSLDIYLASCSNGMNIPISQSLVKFQ